MNITKADLVILNNSTFQASIEFKEDSIPIDLTGYTFHMQCRPGVQSSVVYFELSSATGGGITTDPTHGIININISASETETFKWLDGVYDIVAIKPDGTRLRAMEGSVFIDFGSTLIS